MIESSAKAHLFAMLLSFAMALLLLAGIFFLASRAGQALQPVQAAPAA